MGTSCRERPIRVQGVHGESSRDLVTLRRPRRLVPGDTVAVVATSGPLVAERLAAGVARLESWGLRVRVGAHALDTDPVFPFLAGSDADRAADFEAAWCDPEIAAVFVGRGGAGAARLVGLLDWDRMRAAPPTLLVGFSDVTALQEAVATHLGLTSLVGPMPATEAMAAATPDDESLRHLRTTLFEPERTLVIGHPQAWTIVPGRATGVLVGGTVSLLSGSVGTRESRPAAGGLVLLEDIGERPFRLDNRLTQLLRAGWFAGARGVVLGSWVDCGPDAADLVAARLAHLGVPMVAGLPFGHGLPRLTIPLGVAADLDADRATLTLHQPALA
jgi:muramoyltetrapeptide carboxypeptidase